jgi:uncharacterized membrane protein (DUF373 family)
MATRLPQNWTEIRRDWPVLSGYERFEAFVAFVLTLVITAVILVALWRLVFSVVDTLVLRSLNPLEHGVFQAVFGQILTVLIALEFNHTLRYVVIRELGIIQAKTVILIAVLALVRKLIVTDLSAVPPAGLAAEGGLLLALGITYWLMREGDRRSKALRPGRGRPGSTPGAARARSGA